MGDYKIVIKVSVIIINYKTKELVLNCLDTIYKYTQDIFFEIIVVDNNSNDNIANILLKKYPDVKFIQNEKNSGFGSANNIAIKEAKGKYVFLLNPDTLLLTKSSSTVSLTHFTSVSMCLFSHLLER